MVGNALAPCITRPSAAMILTVQNKHVFVIHEERFQLHAPSYCWKIIENGNTFLCFLKMNSANLGVKLSQYQGYCRHYSVRRLVCMMASSNGNIFRITGHLCREYHWIPLTKANDVELSCFPWSVPEQTGEQQLRRWWFETPLCPLWCHCNDSARRWV